MLAFAVFATAPGSVAQMVPNGPEFEVNTYTQGIQAEPSVGAAENGDFVVVWTSNDPNGGDPAPASVRARRYSAAGAPLGGEWVVNSYTPGAQFGPDVAVAAQGSFVVAWTSYESGGNDPYLSIQARRFDGAGNPLGPDFQVNTYTTLDQYGTSVAGDAQGNFVVVWRSNGSPGDDVDGFSIQGRLFQADGTPRGDQFQINAYTTGNQSEPVVEVGPDGGFVVAWGSDGSSGNDDGWSVQARRFDALGNPLGADFQVNSYTTGPQYVPSVAFNPLGGFVVAWQSYGSSGDDDYWSVQARRFDASGNPLGADFQVNTYATSQQFWASVAADDEGFVVAWTSSGSNGPDTSGWSVQARRYDAAGGALGGEFGLNAITTYTQQRPHIAVDPLGNFVVTWTSYFSVGNDTDSGSIQARRFDGLFRDGVESGDTGRWSAAAP